ncbi:MAG: cytochrome C, partial [Deltaproteobacteria bacterium]|nr:cytochrome C [Deltaproteobacteria bacterium]
MSLVKRIFLAAMALVILVLAGGAGFLFFKKPNQRPPLSETVTATPERLARGQYLAVNALSCLHCHSPINPTRWSAAADLDLVGSGGLCLDEAAGFPGKVCSPNITADPDTGIGAWTDGEIMRAIREGISRDGRPLLPFMNYLEYRQLPDEDVRSIVVFLRTLKPIRKV